MGERGKRQRTAARTQKTRARNARLIGVLFVVILVCAAFALGFIVRDHPYFLQQLGFPESVTGLPSVVAEQTDDTDTYNSLEKRIAEVETVLATDSLDTYDIDIATQNMLVGLADASDDPYLRYYTKERYQALLNTADEGYAGIGVLFSENNGIAYAVDVFEGSEAQLEGVQKGDYVRSVNGDNSQTWSRSEVTAALSQAEGSTVVIEWRRPESLDAEGGDVFTTSLQCLQYNESNVTTEYDSDRKVGYIKVRQLTQNAAALVQTAIGELTTLGAESFVLDLRDNPGGYLTQAVSVASLFMNSGTVVEIQTKQELIPKTVSGQTATDSPLVVLTNKNTAAGAEVLAAALKESQRARMLVGETTLGKGSVQVMYTLSFGGALRYTAAYYLTPEGRAIDKVGIAPDVALESTDSGDVQRDYAMEVAASFVEG